MHIIETAVSIPTKFCTVIRTTKCPSWVVRTHASQIQEGGRPPSWKNSKIATSRPRFGRFQPHLLWRCSSTLWSRPMVKSLKFKKSKMAAAAILKNRKITVSPRFDRFRPNLARRRSSALLSYLTVKSLQYSCDALGGLSVLLSPILLCIIGIFCITNDSVCSNLKDDRYYPKNTN